jgi:hypothetical protein
MQYLSSVATVKPFQVFWQTSFYCCCCVLLLLLLLTLQSYMLFDLLHQIIPGSSTFDGLAPVFFLIVYYFFSPPILSSSFGSYSYRVPKSNLLTYKLSCFYLPTWCTICLFCNMCITLDTSTCFEHYYAHPQEVKIVFLKHLVSSLWKLSEWSYITKITSAVLLKMIS